jgi:hypothetical protein
MIIESIISKQIVRFVLGAESVCAMSVYPITIKRRSKYKENDFIDF